MTDVTDGSSQRRTPEKEKLYGECSQLIFARAGNLKHMTGMRKNDMNQKIGKIETMLTLSKVSPLQIQILKKRSRQRKPS